MGGGGARIPPPINGNDRPSLSDADDGGYFDERAAAYYAESPSHYREGWRTDIMSSR